MPILTKKFSEFITGSMNETNQTVGLSNGANARFPFVTTWTTAGRPTTPTDGLMGFNSTLDQWEYWDNTAGIWQQIPSNSDVDALIARLAAHTAGNGASMIGLEDQGIVLNKTVQDMAEAAFIVKTNNGSLVNAQAVGDLASGILIGTTATGVLLSRILTGTSGEIDVSNGSGIGGNPTIGITDNPVIPGIQRLGLPVGASADRPGVPSDGDFRYNSTLGIVEWYSTMFAAWVQPMSSAGYLFAANNLSDVVSATTSFDNISPTTTKGDIIVFDGVNNIRLGVGTNGNLLTADSLTASGLNWSTSSFPLTAGAAGTIIISDGADWIVSTSLWPDTVGSVGKILRSDGTVNAYTTATYPNVATSTGSMLYADGTNWIASTSLWPNTVGAAGKILRSDGSSNAYTTSTFADTYSASTLLYANGANTVEGLATANSAMIYTNSTGVPAWSASMTNGQLMIGSTGASPSPSLLTEGSGISITNGAGSITIATTISSPFNAINIQRVTTSGAGTYTPTAGMKYVIVRAQAAGGGGGGAATSGATEGAIGGAGGGGEYIEALFTATDIGASKAYSVGAKGTGGAAGVNNGNNGGNTTFNTTWVIAVGGSGGFGKTNVSCATTQFFGGNGIGGTGGSVATGTLITQISGQKSSAVALNLTTSQTRNSTGGQAGSGYPGAVFAVNGAATGTAGNAADTNSGAGGTGGQTLNATQTAGGNGGDGWIEFIEYISA